MHPQHANRRHEIQKELFSLAQIINTYDERIKEYEEALKDAIHTRKILEDQRLELLVEFNANY